MNRQSTRVLLNRYVAGALVLQVLGYAALVGLSAQGDVPPLVDLFGRLPPLVGTAFGVFAIPALLVTLALGAAVELVGLSARGVGVGLVTNSDLLYLAVAYLVAVGVGRFASRTRPK